MSETGLVTILMPNRNHAHYLPRALDSWLAQTWSKIEVLVLDDASTDSSLDVIAAYEKRDARVRAVPLREHHGINRAVTVALDMARGEFIYVAGADDFVEPVFIEHCVTEMNRHPDAGVSFSDPTEYHEQGECRVRYPLYLSEVPAHYDPKALVALFRRNYFHISPNTGIYRTAAFREAGGYIADLHWMSDWFVTHVVAVRHGACFLPEQLTYVTIRSDSYSARSLRDAKAQRPLLEEVVKRLASPAYADVLPRMRDGGLIPEYELRTLFWLLASPSGRKLMTPHLALRIVTRGLWSYLRPLAPVEWRRRLRRAHSERTRSA